MNDTPLKAMREATGLSQREVARRSGVNSGRLSVIERGIPPTEDERAAVLRVLLPILADQAKPKGDAA